MEFAELYLSVMPWVISFILSPLVLLCSRRYILSHFGRSSLAILFLVLAFAIHASGSKPLRSPARIASGMPGAITDSPGTPLTNDVASTFLASDCSWVSSLCVAGIHRSTNATDLLVAWTPATVPAGDAVSVFVSTSLVSWAGYADYDVAGCTSNAVLRIPDLGWLSVVSPVAFYAIGDLADRDFDGLSDAYEIYVTKTNPREPDTDLDGLNDGWELAHGMNPLIANTHSGDGCGTCADDDPDHDGLTNYQEALLGTDPFNADTDGDGVLDGMEALMGMNPLLHAADPANAKYVAVGVAWGDPSTSHSEKYALCLVPEPGSGVGALPASHKIVNGTYGGCDSNSVQLVKGWRYTLTLEHVGHDPNAVSAAPDYDYVCIVSNLSRSASIAVDDPQGLLPGHLDYEGINYASGKSAAITVFDDAVNTNAEVELTIDGRKTGAVLMHGAYTNAPGEVHSATSTLARVDVYCNATAPGMLTLSANDAADGRIRLWECPEGVMTPSHFPRSWSTSGSDRQTFYVSGLSPSTSENDITLELRYSGNRVASSSRARMTAVEIVSEAESNFPTNKKRHVFGPAEQFSLGTSPELAISVLDHNVLLHGMPKVGLHAPALADNYVVDVSAGGSDIKLVYECVEPMAMSSSRIRWMEEWEWRQHCGGLPPCEYYSGMVSWPVVEPLYVSFAGLYVWEGAATANKWGSFTNAVYATDYFDHTIDHASSDRIEVAESNGCGVDYATTPIMSNAPKSVGGYSVEIPMYWSLSEDGSGKMFCSVIQGGSIRTNNAVRVHKYSQWIDRDPDTGVVVPSIPMSNED